jgi:hypothetical protein
VRRIYNKVLYGTLMLPMFASANVSLGTPSSGPLAAVGDFLQDMVDFLGGTGVMFVVFLALTFSIGLWVLIPKQGGAALGYALRACVGGICLFGIATVITYIKSF